MYLKLNWNDKKMSSDCEYAGATNSQGMIWCEKKNIYVTGKEKDTCPDYKK